MALLVFLAAAARTRIVAADLRLITPDGFHRGIVATDAGRGGRRPSRRGWRGGTGKRRLLPGGGERRRGLGHRIVQHQRRTARRRLTRGGTPRRGGHAGFALLREDWPQPPHVADGLFIHAIFHGLEQREAFFLVLDERIALAVATQADPLFQVIEAVEMILP